MKVLKFLVMMLLFLSVEKVIAFDNTIKVYDYAQVITDKEEKTLKENLDKYINKYNIDVALITVRYHEQDSSDSYLNEFYNKNNFGLGDLKSAIMMVIDLKDNKENIHIKTFGSAKDLYSELEINDIINNMESKHDYYDKLNTFITYSDKYAMENNRLSQNDSIIRNINFPLIILVSLIMSLVVIFILNFYHKNNNYECDINCFIKDNSLEISKREDKLITTNTKKKGINDKRN